MKRSTLHHSVATVASLILAATLAGGIRASVPRHALVIAHAYVSEWLVADDLVVVDGDPDTVGAAGDTEGRPLPASAALDEDGADRPHLAATYELVAWAPGRRTTAAETGPQR